MTPAIATDFIRVRGARVHNLQNVDADVRRGRLVVISGVSGSGKSSLAFDTLFAEGQRRYLESLSASTRQFLDQMERPDVDEIDGLPPMLAIEQRAGTVAARSTLATTTEIHDFLRLLYARAGTPHCPQCGRVVSAQSPGEIVARILALDEGKKVMILAPLVRGRKGAHRELFEKICREGFVRARVDGEVVDAAAPPELKKSKPHDIDIIVDRIIVKDGIRPRLHESVELAIKQGEGTCLVSHQEGDAWHDQLYSSRFACPDCGISLPAIEPRTFSFNSPYGACATCGGMGEVESSGDTARAIICPDCHGARLGPVGRAVTFADVPIHEFTAKIIAEADEFLRQLETPVGPISNPSDTNKLEICSTELVAQRIIPEIASRLRFLRKVGLDYLTLDRPTRTLSGGELQRARLAGCLGSGLIGVGYVLDEPTIGLHPRDTRRLLDALVELRDQGNSVIVVEHDLDIIRAADELIDLGPGAGSDGGHIVAHGTPAEVAGNENSPTGRCLSRLPLPLGEGRAEGDATLTITLSQRGRGLPNGTLMVHDATAHNLQNLTVQFPLGQFVCVTGVSGSGKSSLVMDTLVPRVREALAQRNWASDQPISDSPLLTGTEHIDRLVEVDQSPIGRSGRSNPATASGMWDDIRRVFAQTRDARVRGFRASRFSFNAASGRCAECRGHGTRRVAMQFLPDLHIVCPACRGKRFNRQTLQVKFRGKSVADVLEMRIDEAAEFFANFAALHATLTMFVEFGLGYLTLGQSSLTLSGGEAQRIKLASELSRVATGRALFVLDEPTTGLHPLDIARLLHLLQRLVQEGHTVLVIEHNLDVIAAADWVIDLGPEGGTAGGRLVAAGPPKQIATIAESHTGQALRQWLEGRT